MENLHAYWNKSGPNGQFPYLLEFSVLFLDGKPWSRWFYWTVCLSIGQFMLPIGHFGYPIGRNSNSIGRFRNSIGQNRDSYGQPRDPIGIYPALMDNPHAYWNLSSPNGQSPRPFKKTIRTPASQAVPLPVSLVGISQVCLDVPGIC